MIPFLVAHQTLGHAERAAGRQYDRGIHRPLSQFGLRHHRNCQSAGDGSGKIKATMSLLGPIF
ncbi:MULTISPECIES: hypothetical protein [Bradyrhizobium]